MLAFSTTDRTSFQSIKVGGGNHGFCRCKPPLASFAQSAISTFTEGHERMGEQYTSFYSGGEVAFTVTGLERES